MSIPSGEGGCAEQLICFSRKHHPLIPEKGVLLYEKQLLKH